MTTVKLLQVRYAASPEGPWGEPRVLMRSDDPAGGWSSARLSQEDGADDDWFQTRVVEYVPLEPAQVDALVSKLEDLTNSHESRGELPPPLSYAELRTIFSALRSRPAVVDAEVLEPVQHAEKQREAGWPTLTLSWSEWDTLSSALRSGRTK